MHFLTIGKAIVKKFKIGLITTFTLQLFQLFSLVSSHVNNREYLNFFSILINPKVNVIIFYAYFSKTKLTPKRRDGGKHRLFSRLSLNIKISDKGKEMNLH